MPTKAPPNASEVRKVVEERLSALAKEGGAQETATIEWRERPKSIPVILMPIDLLSYNPDTHRIRAQRSLKPDLERQLRDDPFGVLAQTYLHELLKGDPTDPTKTDPDFTALLKDLDEHGQTEPGIITRAGVMINGNTRRAALRDIGERNIRVGVLPEDASQGDLLSLELSLQLRKEHRREYSFMNFLLALDERAEAGDLPAKIQQDFRIKPTTYDRSRWILDFVKEAISRSSVAIADGTMSSMRLVDFETHQGKLEELYRAYVTLKAKSPDHAEALREQRLLAIVLKKSKTDLRLIDPDFTKKYAKDIIPDSVPTATSSSIRIPGTSISVPGPSKDLQLLRELTTEALKAAAIALAGNRAEPKEIVRADSLLKKLDNAVDDGLQQAGKQARLLKRRLGPAERISDACDDLDLAVAAIAEARSTGNFDASDLDEALTALRANLSKLASLAARGSSNLGEGLNWLRTVAELSSQSKS